MATKPKAAAKREAPATSSAKSSVKSRAKAAPKRVAKAKVSRANDDIGEDTRLALWRSLLEIRHVEQRAYDLFLQNLVKGTSHLALGQEAVAAGFATAMQKDDWSFCTYRGHHHTLARGVSMEGVLGELMGRECGLLKGKGGSMHLTSVEHGAMGSYAIIGAHLPIAMGAAWTAQYKKTGQVSVCFFGDGTTNIGAFHEALNAAVLTGAPVIFLVAITPITDDAPVGRQTAASPLDLAKSHGLAVTEVLAKTSDIKTAVSKARKAATPTLIQVQLELSR